MRTLRVLAALAIVSSCSLVPGLAAESVKEGAKRTGRAVVQDLKEAGRAIRDSKAGKAATEAGKEVGRSSAQLGRDVGHAAAEGGREVARFSTKTAREVRRVTVEFWDDVLEGKRRHAAELRKENKELKKQRDRER